ncbi:insulinase family protein [Candidatus Microgenomates bacterium]|nr:insulinase family protein [Candidatus Microgenomates bacterium]
MFSTKTYPSGLRLLTIPVKEVPSVSVLVLVRTGSRYEEEKTNGLAHFTEHMLFQGNKKWPSKLALSTAIDEVGAEFNGMTGKEYTGYFVKAESTHLELALSILSEMLTHSNFANEQIEREKPVIVEEIHYRQDMPQVAVGDMIMEQVFMGHPLGLSTAGEKEAVTKFTRKDFLDFHANQYVSQKTIVVVAGKFGENNIKSQVEAYFKDLKIGSKTAPISWIKQKNNLTRIAFKEKSTDQTHFCLGITAYPRQSPQRYAQALLNTVLGSGISSRLFQKIREEKSLAYYVDSDIDTFFDTGLFTVSAGVNNVKFENALEAVFEELEKIKKPDDLKQKELRKAKDYLRGKLVLRLEESLDQAMFFGSQWLLESQLRTVGQIIKEVEKVTIEEIQQAAKEIFKREGFYLSVVGKSIDRGKVEKILE